MEMAMINNESSSEFVAVDLEQQQEQQDVKSSASVPSAEIIALRTALADVAGCRERLESLGDPPDHEVVEEAHNSVAAIAAALASDLERMNSAVPPSDMDYQQWTVLQAQKEMDMREAAKVAKVPYQAVIEKDELYRSYELLLKDAERDLLKLSGSPDEQFSMATTNGKEEEEREEGFDEEVTEILVAAKARSIMDVNLTGRNLSHLPNAFGSIPTIVALDLSNNKLKLLPDSLGGLSQLCNLKVEENNLESLPDSIGLLRNLKVLNVSRNMLAALPDSIIQCSALETLNANLNQLSYLPSQIGFGLPNLKELLIGWNKLRTLPASVCNLKLLKRLEVKFNQLKGLPASIGSLGSLELLDLSCNFADMQALPDTIGDLISLVEIDISCNQIKVLPDSFGRLQNLKRINLKQTPLVIPPHEVVDAGTEAVMAYMRDKWQSFLEEERQRLSPSSEASLPWLGQTLGGSWLTRFFLGGSGQTKAPPRQDDYLEQQL